MSSAQLLVVRCYGEQDWLLRETHPHPSISSSSSSCSTTKRWLVNRMLPTTSEWINKHDEIHIIKTDYDKCCLWNVSSIGSFLLCHLWDYDRLLRTPPAIHPLQRARAHPLKEGTPRATSPSPSLTVQLNSFWSFECNKQFKVQRIHYWISSLNCFHFPPDSTVHRKTSPI